MSDKSIADWFITLTSLFICLFRLIMLSAQLGPLGEFVLGGSVRHLAVEAHNFTAEDRELVGFFRLRRREFGEEEPYLNIVSRIETGDWLGHTMSLTVSLPAVLTTRMAS